MVANKQVYQGSKVIWRHFYYSPAELHVDVKLIWRKAIYNIDAVEKCTSTPCLYKDWDYSVTVELLNKSHEIAKAENTPI